MIGTAETLVKWLFNQKRDKLFEVKEHKENPISIMIDSGARGNLSNYNQMAGMRGLMAKPTGEPDEIPIKSSFIDGASVSEFFTGTHGIRKVFVDDPSAFDPRKYLTPARELVKQTVAHKMKDVFGSANKA